MTIPDIVSELRALVRRLDDQNKIMLDLTQQLTELRAQLGLERLPKVTIAVPDAKNR